MFNSFENVNRDFFNDYVCSQLTNNGLSRPTMAETLRFLIDLEPILEITGEPGIMQSGIGHMIGLCKWAYAPFITIGSSFVESF